MEDSTYNSNYNTFWGLSDWWGKYNEFIDGFTGSGTTNKCIIDGQNVNCYTNYISGSSVFVIGNDLNCIPKNSIGYSTQTGYCDYICLSSSSSNYHMRSGNGSDTNYGISYLRYTDGAASEYVTTRVVYTPTEIKLGG